MEKSPNKTKKSQIDKVHKQNKEEKKIKIPKINNSTKNGSHQKERTLQRPKDSIKEADDGFQQSSEGSSLSIRSSKGEGN